MSRVRHLGPQRVLLALLLLGALAVRMVVPQGYMWSTGARGSPEMVFCSGMATPALVTPLAAHAMAAQHESDRRDHDGKTVEHPCAFAAASAAVDLAAAVHPATTLAVAVATPVILHRFVRPGLGLAAPPPPKTGPPASA